MPTLDEKYAHLQEILRGYGRVGVAFSGGVDSTLLLKTAHDVLGAGAVALSARLRTTPEFERREASEFCQSWGIRHVVCDVNELTLPEYVQNDPERCYHCKCLVLSHLGEAAEALELPVLAEGTNADDLGDYRPGRRAVLEWEVKSPLLEAGLTKADIRELSARLGLPTWDKPAYACLASRIAQGEPITEEKLRRIEKAESFLISKGFRQMRVRLHGDLVRIEVPPQEIEKLAAPELRQEIATKLLDLGFRYVSLDLLGYRMGSMNPKDVQKS